MNPVPRPDSPASSSGGIEILTTRILPVPRAAVWDAFADPARLARWWGPNGFTNTIRQFDLRPGGAWHLTMHGPDGANYDNVSEFVAVEPPSRIVFHHLQPMHGFRMEMVYEDAGAGRTRLTWRMILERNAEHEKLQGFLAQANEQNFDRLEAELRRAMPRKG